MKDIAAVERDQATGMTKLVDAENQRARFIATSRDAAERLAVLLGVEFIEIPYYDYDGQH